MGKGDKKTRRGKIIKGTYGVRRLRKKSRKYVVAKQAEAEKPIVEEAKKTEPIKKEATAKPAAKKSAAKKTTAKPATKN